MLPKAPRFRVYVKPLLSIAVTVINSLPDWTTEPISAGPATSKVTVFVKESIEVVMEVVASAESSFQQIESGWQRALFAYLQGQ